MFPRAAVRQHRRLVRVAVLLAGLAAATPEAHAETTRRAVLVSNGDGGAGLGKLRYTGRDVNKMRDVLVDLGGFNARNIDVVMDSDAPDVIRHIRAAEDLILADKAAGKEALLLVYYSGHAKDGFLRMGKSKLDLALLRGMLEDSRADVRVAIIDACGAGEITREKGGHVAPPLVVQVDDALTARGQVIIASSSETESSQESDDVQGSFFTHYWVSGLRGDADRSGDGKVTLDEAYAYAYGKTVAATVNTRAGIQHPTYRYNLRGAGDVVMANLAAVNSGVNFPEEMAGRYVVFDVDRQLVVAEVDKEAGKALRIAVKGGTYAIKKRERDHLLMQRVKVAHSADVELDPSRMERVSFDKDYAKGALIDADIPGIPHGMSGFSFSGGVGAQGFYDLALQGGNETRPSTIAGVPSPLKNILTRPAFPATVIASMQTRYHGLLNKHLLLAADLNLGLRDYWLVLNTGASEVTFNTRFFMADLGVSPMWEQEFLFFRFAVGPRLSGLFTWRYVLDDSVTTSKSQFYLNMAPGVAAYAGVDIFRFLHLELGARGNLSVFAIDGLRAIGYGSLTLAVHADL